MQPVSVVLAAALMLGGMSVAYAQGGSPQKEGGPSQAQEQQAPGGGTSRGVQSKTDQGDSSKSGSRAERSGGERQRSAGESGQDSGESRQGARQQAQDEGARKQKDGARASKQDDDSAKRADRKGSESKDAKRADRDDDRSKDAKRADRDDDRSKDAKRADRDDDRSKDAKRADRDDDRSKDAKRADRDDDRSKDAKRADRDDDRSKDAKRADRDDDRSKGDRKRAEADDDGRKHVELTGERKTRVQSVFREHADVRERTDVDIDIHVGSRLPRDWDYYPVPEAVIEIVPEYRDYRFVYVEDRYVIVNPSTYEVVTVIDSSGGRTFAGRSGRGGGSGGCTADLSLSDDDREYLLRSIQMQNVDVGDVTIGMDVPASVELRTFPDSVIDRVSALSECRYFVADDRIAIVDPNQQEVVVLVD